MDLIVITHTGWDIGFPGACRCSPAMAAHALREIGDFKLVLAHMAGWGEWDKAIETLSGTNAYLDTAFSTGHIHPLQDGYWDGKDTAMLDTKTFLAMLDAFGEDRILFGTDSPWSPQEESLDFIRDLPVSERTKEKILGGNASMLLSIPS